MAKLQHYTPRILREYLNKRPGEKKLGEEIGFPEAGATLSEAEARFVLIGIPEDIGVRANYGKAGTAKAWPEALKALLNIQSNHFLSGRELLLLGEIDCAEEMQKASNLDVSDPNYFVKMGELVAAIDKAVSTCVKEVVTAGKTPIVVGGGHNNAYGNIRGTSEALSRSVNALNIDAHTDLRQPEHRHSGNGFSYALQDGYLNTYGVFGLHQNYTPQYIFEQMNESPNLQFVLFEELTEMNRITGFLELLDEVGTQPFGLEVDCDVMANFPSSAQSPTGFTLNAVREMVRAAGQHPECKYLHLCEAIPADVYPTGKGLAYLISDFAKAGSNGDSLF